jgi:hypothetical protein
LAYRPLYKTVISKAFPLSLCFGLFIFCYYSSKYSYRALVSNHPLTSFPTQYSRSLYNYVDACYSGLQLSHSARGTTAGTTHADRVQRHHFVSLRSSSSRTMVLGSTQPLTEMSTRKLPGGKKRPARSADNLKMSENVGASTSRNPKGLHGLYRDKFTLPYLISVCPYMKHLENN